LDEIRLNEQAAKRRRFLINLLYWCAVLAILYGILHYLIGWILPFLIGFVIARLLNPPIRFLARKTRIPRKPIAFLFVILFFGVIGTPLTFGGIWLFHETREQAAHFGEYYIYTVEPALRETERWIMQNLGMFFPDWEIGGDGAHLTAWLAGQIAAVVDSISFWGLATATPSFITNLLLRVLFTGLFTLFSTVYYEEALSFILRQMSDQKRRFLSDTIIAAKRSITNYFGAYLKIMAVTFVELLIGLSIIRGSFSIIPALAISMVDFIPALGCGTVLIPWALISLITGNTTLGIGLLILYVIIFGIRQLIEPKIVGDQLGLNPLLTLAAMYVGFLAIGVLGLIIMPIIITVLADLQRGEKIHLVN
jgi:sporulation integral membrane protein YtvI